MNATCEWVQTSAVPAARSFVNLFAETWLENQEFRVAVFSMVLLCAIMVWVTSMVREIVRAASTVLCTLQVSGCASSCAPCSRNASIGAPALAPYIRHRTDGGPPPGPPPDPHD